MPTDSDHRRRRYHNCRLSADDPAWAELPEGRNALPGSVCFVPATAGMILTGEVVKDIIQVESGKRKVEN